MKNKTLISILIFSICLFVETKAQSRIEILEKDLIVSTNEKRVDILNELAYLNNKPNYKKALTYQNEALKLAKELKYTKGLGQAYQNLGDFNKIRNKVNIALSYYQKSLGIAGEHKNIQAEYRLNYSIGLCYTQRANYKDSKKYFEKALELAESIKTDSLNEINIKSHINNIAGLYLRIADILVSEKNHNKAIEFYEKSINLSNQSNNFKFVVASFYSLAGLLISTKEYSKADNLLDSAISLSRKYDLQLSLAEGYSKKAELFFSINKFDDALICCDSSININRQFNEMNLIAEINIQKAEIYFKKNDIFKAEEIFLNGIKELKKLKNEVGLGNAYYKLGELYNMTEKFEESNKYLKLALIPLKNNNAKDLISEVYKLLSANSIKLNDLNSALDYQSKKNEILDSSSKQNVSTLIKNIELKSEIERKRQDAEIMQKENAIKIVQKNNLLILSLIILFALLIISVLLYSRYRLKNRTSKQFAELNATKDKFFTIISHDLKTPVSSFNNLAVILADYYDDFTEEEKLKHINSLKDSSAGILKLLENILIWSRIQTEKMKSNPEVFQLMSMVDTEIQNQKQIGDKKNIHIISEIQPNTYVFADKDMIGLVIRNLLSNAIKYTFENDTITISTREDKENIEIDIMDSGVGIKDEDKTKIFNFDVKHSTVGTANEKGTGLGLNLCKEFIEMNKGKIWFESQFGKGSTFKFILPKAVIENN